MSSGNSSLRVNEIVSGLVAALSQEGSVCSQTSQSEMRAALSKLHYLARNHSKLHTTAENVAQFGSPTEIVTDSGVMKRYLDIAVVLKYASRKDGEYSLTDKGVDFIYPPSHAEPTYKKGGARWGNALKATRIALGTRDPNA